MSNEASTGGRDPGKTTNEGTLSRRSFLTSAGASAGFLALDALLCRHGGAQAAALRSQLAETASGAAGPPGHDLK